MKARLAFIAAMAFTAAVPAQAMPDVFHVGDPTQWGRVKRVVVPEFPKAALEQARSGYVDVRGRVSPLGLLEEIEYSPEDAHSGVFIDPIRRVISHWELEPPLGRDCQPSELRVTNRVWFEVKDGKPSVSVSLVRPQAPAGHATLQPLQREDPIYPSSMRRSNTEAVVFTRVRIDAAGEVVAVEPQVYPRRRGTSMREFQHEVIRALTQWRYPPAPASSSSRVVCYDVRFKLSD